MMSDLWSRNHLNQFWLLQPDPPENLWQEAIRQAIPILELPIEPGEVDDVLALTLGEGQFGPKHFNLSLSKQLYYQLKPLLPRNLINSFKKVNARYSRNDFPLHWPIEDRYARFQWEIIRQMIILTGEQKLKVRHFWPDGNQFALILTHDVETAEGQKFVREVADFEEELGFHSSFNFVPERYSLDHQLIKELKERGFEIGVHGLKHDGKLYSSENEFYKRSKAINAYLEMLGAVGFRSPLMQRNPDWMQVLKIEYDLSFFDTDPYEPMPGGCMTIWPFTIGHFIELPYTLVQDSTLGIVLGETTPRLWLEKLKFIEKYNGMALVNTHPEYLNDPKIWEIYLSFLHTIKEQKNYWHTRPRDVARWWRKRTDTPPGQETPEMRLGTMVLENRRVRLY